MLLISSIIHFISTLYRIVLTYIICLLTGLSYKSGWRIYGKPIILNSGLFNRHVRKKITIGDRFLCSNSNSSNSIGLIQPCVFNISTKDSRIIIGNNVGISGSTINATTQITIGNNVLIGSGCIITDTDSHPLDWHDRLIDDMSKVRKKPIEIGNNVFIGARSIILKGVVIGEKSIIGAGSVVSANIPPNCIAAGNPAKVIKYL